MNNILVDKITKLTKEWYRLIAIDHHKDRDCHWGINTKWSYGKSPYYVVEHFGYIISDIEIKCNTYQEALEVLEKSLEEAIQKEKNYNINCNENTW